MNYTSEKSERHVISFTKEEVWNLLLEKAKSQIQSEGYNFEKEVVEFRNLSKELFISSAIVTLINPIKGDESERKSDNQTTKR